MGNSGSSASGRERRSQSGQRPNAPGGPAATQPQPQAYPGASTLPVSACRNDASPLSFQQTRRLAWPPVACGDSARRPLTRTLRQQVVPRGCSGSPGRAWPRRLRPPKAPDSAVRRASSHPSYSPQAPELSPSPADAVHASASQGAGYPGANYPGAFQGPNGQMPPMNQLQTYFLEGMRPELAYFQQPRLPVAPPQMQRTFTIRNDVNLKKNTLKLIRDPAKPSCYHVEFIFDASTDCRISVHYASIEQAAEGVLT